MTQGTAVPGCRNIRIELSYDGTSYLGWQVQPQGPTIQSTLQQSLLRITGERIIVKGSGRTDAGVHALGQVANFRTSSPLPPEDIVRALNSVLPSTIAIRSAAWVDDGFDAQFSSVGKMYSYRVVNSRFMSPFELNRAWHVRKCLNIDSMKASSSLLIGIKDFSSFRAAGCVARSPVRSITRCDVGNDGDVMTFEFEGNGFLRHMVRNIVGTLIDVGRGRFSTSDFSSILDARDRTRAGITAPPHGLFLVRVDYPP